MTPGMINGSVTRQNVTHSFAPRSIAASSTALSKLCKRARTVNTTNGILNAMCDTITVLDFGRVLSTGTPDAVAHDPKVREAYLGAVAQDLEEAGA